MNKEYCYNCGAKICLTNWKIGKFRCYNCKDDKISIDKDKLINEATRALEYKYKKRR